MAKEMPSAISREVFCQEFSLDFNASRAARAAGYSEKTARSQGSRLLTFVDVQERIKEILGTRLEKVGIDGEKVLERLDNFSNFDPADAYDEETNSFKKIHDIPIHLRKCIESVETNELFEVIDGKRVPIGHTVKVSFVKRTKPTELLGKHKVLFTDKLEVSASDELAARLKKSRERAK